MAWKKNKNNDQKIQQEISDKKLINEITDENTAVLSLDKKTKVTRDNVFQLIREQAFNKRNLVVPKKVLRLLKHFNNWKRTFGDTKNLKNEENKIVEIKDVSKYYISGNIITCVLNNVNLSINKGEILFIYGVSGGGKSTLLNLISGLDRPTKGDVIVCDENLAYKSNSQLTLFRRQHVSFIFQNYNLLENLTAFDNVETGAYLQKDKSKKYDTLELFERFGMKDEFNKYPSQLSGGQQQRVSIMRALAKNAEIIFADEPTGALDEETSRIVLKMLYDINKELGTTIVMVSHDPKITGMADRVVHIVKGSIAKITINKNPISPDKLKYTQ